HFPIRAGGFGSLRTPWAHALGRRLSAESQHGNWRIAGAHHFNKDRLDYLGAGDLRARRRLHGPGAGRYVYAPRCLHEPKPPDRRAWIYPAVDPLASFSRILDP